MRNIAAVFEILLLAVSLVLLLAVICDFFGVYLPGIVYVIPEGRRPLPETGKKPAPDPVYRDVVIIRETESN